MKKLLLLSAYLIFACSGDDSSNSIDPIEGQWNYLSSTDCGDPVPVSACDLQSYITFSNGLVEFTIFNNADENEIPIPCKIINIIEFSYSPIPNSSNRYNLDNGISETALILVEGNTLSIITEEDAINTSCPQQVGTIIETSTFVRD